MFKNENDHSCSPWRWFKRFIDSSIHLGAWYKHIHSTGSFWSCRHSITYWRTSEQAQAWPGKQSAQACQVSYSLSMDRYLDYVMTKTQVPMCLDESMYKLDIHESTTQRGYTQGTELLESSLSEKVLRLWWTTSWPHANSVSLWKKRPTVSWAAWGKALPRDQGMWSFLYAQHWLMDMRMLDPSLRHHEHAEVSPTSGHKCDEGTGAPFTERLRKLEPFCLENALGGLTNVHKYPMQENKEDRFRLFSVTSSENRRDSVYKPKRKTFHLTTRKRNNYEGDQTLEQVIQKWCVVSVLEDTKSPPEIALSNLLHVTPLQVPTSLSDCGSGTLTDSILSLSF